MDGRQLGYSTKLYPKAKVYQNFRRVYDKDLSAFDAIMLATPDHTHASIALPFMRA